MKLLDINTIPLFKDFNGPNDPKRLSPKIGQSFENEPALQPILKQANSWNLKTAIRQLDYLIDYYPMYKTKAIRLKAEIYGTSDQYQAAWELWDQILAEKPSDLQALFLTTIYAHILNSPNYYIERYVQLNKYFPNAANRLTQLISFIDRFKANNKLWRLGQKQEPLDGMLLFGKEIESDGSISETLEARLEATLRLANDHPNAKIIVSGGAVANQYNEAETMSKWLMARNIMPNRIIIEPNAKDTVGNALESAPFILNHHLKSIAAISSAEHLPRAWMSLKAHPKLLLNQINISAFAPIEERYREIPENEQKMSYTTVLRVSQHFSYQDFI
ncbi:YdcF family protein [Fundicoccus sp. Sow4_H7]|uniref:YdcF family protein n=1 Tax=Fundicoccus sp. Sow4_H7 TaxID=3438784 RepID=UPI003F93C807